MRRFGAAGACWVLVVGAMLTACDGDNVVPKPIGHTGIGDDDDDDDTTVPSGDDEASVILTVQQPSSLDPAGSTTLTALFVESDRGWLNLVDCFTSFCATQLPAAVGDSVLVQPTDETLKDELLTRDMGNRILLGDLAAKKQEDGSFLFYSSVESGPADLGSAPMGLTLGGAWPDYRGTDDISPPSPIVVTQPAPTESHEFLSSDGIHLEWEAGGRGDVMMLVTTPVERRLYWLEDTGSYDLDLEPLALADGALVAIDLGRWSRDGVDLDGNVVTMFVKSNQHLEGDWRNLDGRQQLTDIYDTCAEALGGVPLVAGNYIGDISTFENDLRPRIGQCTAFTATGQDGIVPIDLRDNDQLEVTYRLPTGDGSIYLTTDCEDLRECVAGRDGTVQGGDETFAYVNDQGDRRMYLVLDGFEPYTSAFNLDVEITSLGGAVFQDTCAEAIGQGPVEPNAYQGRLGGNQNLLQPDCSPNSDGGEGVLQVFLLPGETLDAQVTTNGSPNAAMYLMYNCSIADSCLPGVAPSKRLSYQNQTGASEFLYLVLDGPPGLDTYVLDLLIY